MLDTIEVESVAARILFCDIVGFSRNSSAKQGKMIHDLYQRVRGFLTSATDTSDIVTLPTGDGLAIAFTRRPNALDAVMFQLIEQLQGWALDNASELRIGVHSGNMDLLKDVNDHPNLCGPTVNTCQRIMDAAKPAQVLVSDAFHRDVVGDMGSWESRKFTKTFPVVVKQGECIQVRIMFEGDEPSHSQRPHPVFLQGKDERAKFIHTFLEQLVRQPGLTIRERAAFSIFWVDDIGTVRRFNEEWSNQLCAAIVDQRDAMNSLIKAGASLRLIVDPTTHSFDRDYLLARYDALIKWMSDHADAERVQFVEAPYQTNQLIVAGTRQVAAACFEGLKFGHGASYDLTAIEQNPDLVRQAVNNFDEDFDAARRTLTNNRAVIEQMKNHRRAVRKSKKLVPSYAAK